MADDLEPARKFYTLKPRQFERVNTPPPDTAPVSESAATSMASATPAPSQADPIDVRQLARLAAGGTPPLSGHAPAARANDVHALLQQNHAHAAAAGLNEVSLRPRRRSKRSRDYACLLVAGNGFIFTLYAVQIFIGFQVQCLAAQMPMEFTHLLRYAVGTPALYAIPALGMVVYSSTLTWLMFHVMDDY